MAGISHETAKGIHCPGKVSLYINKKSIIVKEFHISVEIYG
jgi:hypothetical protein